MKQWSIQLPAPLTYEHLGVWLCSISLRNKVFWVAEVCIPCVNSVPEKNSCSESWYLSKPCNSLKKHWISLGETVMQLLIQETPQCAVLTISWDISGSLQLRWWMCCWFVAMKTHQHWIMSSCIALWQPGGGRRRCPWSNNFSACDSRQMLWGWVWLSRC